MDDSNSSNPPMISQNKKRKVSEGSPRAFLEETIARRPPPKNSVEWSSPPENGSQKDPTSHGDSSEAEPLLDLSDSSDESSSTNKKHEEEEAEDPPNHFAGSTEEDSCRDQNLQTPYQEALAAIQSLHEHEMEQRKEQDDEEEVVAKPPDFNASFLCTEDSEITWSYDPKNRIIRADCSNIERLKNADVGKLAYLMQRDDLTLITKGLFMKLDDVDDFLSYVASSQHVYHKFRRFLLDIDTHRFVEVNGYVEMTPSAYVQYLDALESDDEMATVSYTINGVPETSNVHDIRLYMVDVDISVLYRQLKETYNDTCKWKDVLPGGKLCMMGEMPKSMQPFMGPNLYITPGATYTRMHQDGFGSVDSGHSNLYGTNEVIMLRRLPEVHKRNASKILREDALYRMPHDDDTATKCEWPTNDIIQQWEALNYCPARFLLLAGEHVHINKGRLHAFRKLSNDPLPDHDCHAKLRREFLKSHTVDRNICVSIAYDWMYMGFQAEAIETEVKTVLESSEMIRTVEKAKTLAVGEAAVFCMAETITSASMRKTSLSAVPDKAATAKGILRPLTYLVFRDDMLGRGDVAPVDADEDPAFWSTDPYGNDYFCKICHHELANTYFHCQGCEQLLQMDFNICVHCYKENKFRTMVEMKPYASGQLGCHLHHDASTDMKKCSFQLDCDCNSVCQECACDCHNNFVKRHRFRSDSAAKKLLEKCVSCTGEAADRDRLEKWASENRIQLHTTEEEDSGQSVGESVEDSGQSVGVPVEDSGQSDGDTYSTVSITDDSL